MYTLSNMPDEIPIFPLSGALLLPNAKLPLNIFEPRYLQMIEDCFRSEHRLIGMIQPRETPHDAPKSKLESVGCAGRIISYSETEDRRFLITLNGISRFKILEEKEGFHPYRVANVSWGLFSQDFGPKEQDEEFNRDGFLHLLGRYFEHQGLSTDWDALKSANQENMINSLSMLCPFQNEEKQALLECESLKARRETLSALLEFALRENGSKKDRAH